jgi:transcriptional regulator with XRE-family HTH domain
MNFKDYINREYINWMSRQGERKTISEFAKYLDVNQGDLSHWLNGTRAPKGGTLAKVARALGPDAYQAAGQPEPMPDSPILRRTLRNMSKLPPAMQEQIADAVEKRAMEIIEQKKAQGTNQNQGMINFSLQTST